jgi:hypothetical protein
VGKEALVYVIVEDLMGSTPNIIRDSFHAITKRTVTCADEKRRPLIIEIIGGTEEDLILLQSRGWRGIGKIPF